MAPTRCIIIDDEPLAGRLLASYVSRTEGLELAGVYCSAEDGLEALLREKPRLALLDIDMPRINGVEIARKLDPDETSVIFTTAYRDYAIDGFRVRAVDYLLKPVSYEEFLEALSRIRPHDAAHRHMSEQYISVRSDRRMIRIPATDILCIEGLKDYIKIHLKTADSRTVLTLMSMKNVEALLDPCYFMRVHRSYIVRLDRICSFTRNALTLRGDNGKEITVPVSDSCRQDLMDYLKAGSQYGSQKI